MASSSTIREWPHEPIKCFYCYDLGVVIDPFKQNERKKCECQITDESVTQKDIELSG